MTEKQLTPIAVSPATAAELLDCSRDHIYSLLTNGQLPSFKSGARVLVEYAGLLDYLESVRRSA
jgi:excisionase family DNA binding protein